MKTGLYYYKVNKFDGTFEDREAKVEIIDETDKSYKIKLLEFTHNRIPKDTLWVRKRKVGVNIGNEIPKNTHEENYNEEEYWWQNK